MKKIWFWLPWSVGAIVAAVFVAFFFIGIADGSVSSFNFVLWIGILATLGAILGGSLWLRRAGQMAPAIVLAWLLGAPGLLAALFLILMIVLQPRWN